jgi:HAD superfamily hydrolase (TIGR01548 family)
MPTPPVPSVRHPVPCAGVAGKAYARGEQVRPIDLRLDANEGFAPSAEFLASNPPVGEDVSIYPVATELEAALARELNLRTGRAVDVSVDLMVAAGADDAIERLCRVMAASTDGVAPGRCVVVTDPTFEMIPRFVTLAGGRCVTVPWLPPPGANAMAFPVEAVIAAAHAQDASLVCMVTPNNPTGLAASLDDIRRVREGLKEHVVLLVDLAYGEFDTLDVTELTRTVAHMPATIVTRTFSKAWGLAGLRVGFAVGDERVIGWMRRCGLPYAVSGPSLRLALAWRRAGAPVMAENVTYVRDACARLAGTLRVCGINVLESKANFVFACLGCPHRATLLADLLAGLGIAVRRYTGSALLNDCLRISAPPPPAFQRVEAAVQAALTPKTILFDMDGVLVDVSESYRGAIIATCAAYGCNITIEDIALETAKGNANNDWVLTQRILAQRGITVSLPEVTARFEAIYQGTPEASGLRERESAMLTLEELLNLKKQFTLGIVTGRPRNDAHRFITSHGWDGVFGAVVCMEDGPLKPSPAPVELCLQRLNVSSSAAWMLGDTPDDVRAARSAGVVPVGIVPPGEDVSDRTAMLLRAGAARVLTRASGIRELLEQAMGSAQGT